MIVAVGKGGMLHGGMYTAGRTWPVPDQSLFRKGL